MNRRIFTAIIAATFLMSIGTAFAQSSTSSREVTVKLVKPIKTAPMRNMPNLQMPAVMKRIVGNRQVTQQYIDSLRKKLVNSGVLQASGTHRLVPVKRMKPAMQSPPAVHDSVLQASMARRENAPSPKTFTVPMASFDGMGQSSGDAVGCAPPDTNAAAGENYVVELINVCDIGVGEFEVYDKTGKAVMGPIALSSLWSSGNCVNGQGDDVVLYDQLAQRWILSQFAENASGSSVTDECVAVSVTSDPTGAYYIYDFSVNPNGFTDYPKIGIWPDAYYAAFNDFDPVSQNFKFVDFVAFERSQMLQGLPAQEVVIHGTDINSGGVDYSALPADLDGYTPPPTGTPGIFVNYISPGLLGPGYPYALMMWQMHVDWLNPSNSTVTGPTQISVAPFIDGAYTNVPEPGGEALDTLGDRLMFRLAYRNLGAHQALVVNQTVTASGTASPPLGIRWYELDAPSGATSATAWSVAQQATYAPADGTSRWMGSVAMDHSGDMALGFSTSSPNDNPGISYTGRLATDPVDTMTEPETVLKAGSGYQVATGNRWGDYSSMAIDPTDDCTFWYAQEYYAVTGQYNWSTHIGAFKFAGCTKVALGTLQGTVTDASTGNPVAGAYVSAGNGFAAITDKNGQYSIKLAAGTYTATAKAYPYAPASGVQVTITAGQSTTQDIALQPAQMVTLSGAVTDGGTAQGAHGWGLYAHIEIKLPTPYGTVANAYTDPASGKYSVQVAKGYTYTIVVTPSPAAYDSGYDPLSKELVVNQDTTQNFAVNVATVCHAPGYGYSFGENFNEKTFPPTGWQVTDDVSGSPVVWQTNTDWGEGNFTGGSGLAAVADSNYAYPYTGNYDTSLVSPPIQVANLGGSEMLHFLVNFQSYSGDEALDVDVSLDGGTTWTNALHLTSNLGAEYALPGASETVDLSPYIPTGTKQFQLRWRYYNLTSGYDWYAQVDNVGVGVCTPLAGGLVVGQVTDANSGDGVSGVLLTDDLANTTMTSLTPNDPNLKDIYAMFTAVGMRTLVASVSSSSFVSSTVNVTADQAIRKDMALGNADITVSDLSGSSVTQGESGDVAKIVVTNNGPDTATDASLNLTLGSGLSSDGASAGQGTCTKQSKQATTCDFGDIASGDSVTVTLKGFGLYAGQTTVSASVSDSDNDPDTTNNSGTTQVTVSEPSSTSGGSSGQSSGGGGLGWLTLAALLGLALGAEAWAKARRVR